MPRFYFTYGTDGQPFVGGWTEIESPNVDVACFAFRHIHPDRTPGLLNCSSVYTEEQFKLTGMNGPEGNFGRFCQETITVNITRKITNN